MFMFWVLTTRPQHTNTLQDYTIFDLSFRCGMWDVCMVIPRHLPPLDWSVNGTVSIRYKYIGEAFHATQRQTKSLKETSVSMILRSLRCWWWLTRKPVMGLCLYNVFQHSHSKRVPNYVLATNNGALPSWPEFLLPEPSRFDAAARAGRLPGERGLLGKLDMNKSKLLTFMHGSVASRCDHTPGVPDERAWPPEGKLSRSSFEELERTNNESDWIEFDTVQMLESRCIVEFAEVPFSERKLQALKTTQHMDARVVCGGWFQPEFCRNRESSAATVKVLPQLLKRVIVSFD